MHQAGTASWRVEVGDSQLCEIALFVRDAAGLRSDSNDVPPLDGPVPQPMPFPTEDERTTARRDWTAWWRALVGYEARQWSAHTGANRASFRDRIADRDAVCDPPTFEALADRPALRRAAQTAFADFRTWEASMPRHRGGAAPPGWELIRQVVEDVAFDGQVPFAALQAKIVTVRVQGSWWQRVAPGCALCSPAALATPTTAHAVLRDALDSFVRRNRDER